MGLSVKTKSKVDLKKTLSFMAKKNSFRFIASEISFREKKSMVEIIWLKWAQSLFSVFSTFSLTFFYFEKPFFLNWKIQHLIQMALHFFRSGHAFATIGEIIYMFGGRSNEDEYYTDVYALDTGAFHYNHFVWFTNCSCKLAK